MPRYYKQIQYESGRARSLLRERLARKEIGDAAYDEAASHNNDRAFKIFGIVFILFLAAVIFIFT